MSKPEMTQNNSTEDDLDWAILRMGEAIAILQQNYGRGDDSGDYAFMAFMSITFLEPYCLRTDSMDWLSERMDGLTLSDIRGHFEAAIKFDDQYDYCQLPMMALPQDIADFIMEHGSN